MQDHNIPLSLFIISVYILTVLVLWNIFSNGHVTVTSCLFLRYDPSTRPKKSLKCGKSTNASSWIRDFFTFFNFQNGVLQEGIWGGLQKIIFVSILHVISFCNYFKTTLRPNWLPLFLNFCSLSSTKPLLASVWRSNFYSESQKPCACDAYYRSLFSNFLKISRSSDNERQTGEEEEGQEAGAEGGVEVDEKQ